MGFLSCCLVGCSDAFETEPLNLYGEDVAFDTTDSLGAYAQKYLNGIYAQLPGLHNRIGYNYLDAGTDDAIPSKINGDGNNVESFRNRRISPLNVVDNQWNGCYKGIRGVNVFLSKIDRVPMKNQQLKKQWVAEARFLRTFFYFELLKRWGGVPMVGNQVYGLDDTIELPRSSLDACVDYILSELDAIQPDLLNPKGLADLNFGRVNQGAALALRSRLLLYMASPLFNPSNDAEKWQKAADAAKAVIDMKVYSLHADFSKLFTTLKNNEAIMLNESAQDINVELRNSPVGYASASFRCSGLTSPSQNLVDAFLMKNGMMIDDPASGYDAQNPYVDRDARLAATIFHNGSQWLGRAVETFEGGVDRPNAHPSSTKTGYYLRKFMGAFESSSSFSNTDHSFLVFRYAEILLNYAEALNEAGGSVSEIESAIMAIRKRAGIAPGSGNRYGLPQGADQATMRHIIRNERRIELAFEEHRFWDIRRWKIAGQVMNQPVKGMRITRLDDGSFAHQVEDVRQSWFDERKMYLFPIPYHELLANKMMVQNGGWVN